MTGGELVFGPFCLSLARRELLKDGIPVPLGSRAFDLLTALVQRQGSVVGKDELLAEVWPDTVVEENNLRGAGRLAPPADRTWPWLSLRRRRRARRQARVFVPAP